MEKMLYLCSVKMIICKMRRSHLFGALLGMVVLTVASPVTAQVEWGVTYTTEGHYGVASQQAAWANLLELDLGVGLWQGASLEASTLSSYDTSEGVTADRQVYSNILTDNRALSLFRFELVERWERFELGVGLTHINHHFFASPHSALFTGSSHGIYPTLGDNFGLGNFPVASLGIHMEAALTDRLSLHGHVANGQASDRLGRQFRLRPDEDGVLGIAELRWVTEGENGDEALGWHVGAVADRHVCAHTHTTLFLYGDQPVMHWGDSSLGLLVQGSWATGNDMSCRSYVGGGLWADGLGSRSIDAGAVVNRATYADGWETDIELTCVVPVTDWLTLQPALHILDTDTHWDTVAMIRATIELGNK